MGTRQTALAGGAGCGAATASAAALLRVFREKEAPFCFQTGEKVRHQGGKHSFVQFQMKRRRLRTS